MNDEQHDPTSQGLQRPEPGTIELTHHVPGLAVVDVRGEHDLSTVPALSAVLEQAAAHSHVIVDLSECTFIDSTVIAALLATAHAVKARDERFVLVIPSEQRRIARVAEMTGLPALVDVRTTREAALASVERSQGDGSQGSDDG